MPKIISIVLVLLLLTLYSSILPVTVYAVSCSDKTIGIDYTPKYFSEKSTDYNLTFSVPDKVRSFLSNNYKYIRYRTNMLRLDWATDPIPVPTGNSFQITIPKYPENDNLFKLGGKSGKLEYSKTSKPSDFEEFCTDINFNVGFTDCYIDPQYPLPKNIQPGTEFDIRFIGTVNEEYTASIDGFAGLDSKTLGKTTTDSEGQGRFRNVVIGGKPGDKKNLKISARNGAVSCGGEIVLDIHAPAPVKPPEGPIDPASISANKIKLHVFDGETKKSAGIPCPGGIETAIGCIPTDPTAFVRGFLGFAVAIAGGIALLIMVFGSFKMITSAGNPDSLKEGQEMFTNAIIGLLFIIFSTLLLKIIGVDILGLGKFLGV